MLLGRFGIAQYVVHVVEDALHVHPGHAVSDRSYLCGGRKLHSFGLDRWECDASRRVSS